MACAARGPDPATTLFRAVLRTLQVFVDGSGVQRSGQDGYRRYMRGKKGSRGGGFQRKGKGKGKGRTAKGGKGKAALKKAAGFKG